MNALQREVENKHGSLEQRGGAPSSLERAPNRSNSAAEKSRQLSRDRTPDLDDIKDMITTLGTRMSMVEDAQSAFDDVGIHLTSQLEGFMEKMMTFTKNLEVKLEHLEVSTKGLEFRLADLEKMDSKPVTQHEPDPRAKAYVPAQPPRGSIQHWLPGG